MHKKIYKTSSKFVYIPFGVLDIYRLFSFRDMPKSDLLFLGRIAEYKGIRFLLEAIETIFKKKNTNIDLIIAGSGRIDKYKNKIDELGITLLNRHLTNEEITSLIKNTKIVVLPYTDVTQSGVIMTTFAFNKPVIASAIGSFKEIISNNVDSILFESIEFKRLISKN